MIDHGDEVRLLGAGESLTLGRGPNSPLTGAPVDLVVDDHPSLHRHAATVSAETEGWSVTAAGRLRVGVIDPESGGRLWAMSGSGPLRVGLAAATIELEPAPGHIIEISIRDQRSRGTAYLSSPPVDLADVPSDPTAVARIDEQAGYFRALVLLCEPLLGTGPAQGLPTDQQIAVRLNQTGLEARRQTVRSVEHRLAYARQRLGLAADGAGSEVTGAREKLARFAITSGAIRREHLHALQIA